MQWRFIFVLTFTLAAYQGESSQKRSFSFLFGSCNDQEESQRHWEVISSIPSDGWIWLGDSTYADYFSYEERVEAYNEVKKNSDYKKLIQSRFVMGTWDDHDYAYNNSGSEYEAKADSKKAFLNFIGEPLDSPKWTRKGIYGHAIHKVGKHQLMLIALDLRYFKPKKSHSANLLGESQLAWLEELIKTKPVDMLVILSSFQFLPDFDKKETWYQYRRARQNMIDLISQSSTPTLILSGDRHFVEFSKMKLPNGTPIYEFTSSGLTHTSDRKNDNSFRIGKVIRKRNFGRVTIFFEPSGPVAELTAHSATDGSELAKVMATYKREMPNAQKN